MNKLQLLLIIIMILCAMETISTSKDYVAVSNKNTQSTDEVMLDLHKNECQYKQDFQDQQAALKKKNFTSNFTGVSWNNDRKKWQAKFVHNKTNYFGGLFDNEDHAAMKVNLLCDKCKILRKNPAININPNEIYQKSKTSKFTGVNWNTENKKWFVQLMHKRKKYFGGYFDDEEHAAMKVNLLCDKLEMERKNGTININPNSIQQMKSKTSKFTGVYWTKNKKWFAQLMHNRKKYYGGYFDNEQHAAMKVNLLCDKLEMKRKNHTINIKFNTRQQDLLTNLVIDPVQTRIETQLEPADQCPDLLNNQHQQSPEPLNQHLLQQSPEPLNQQLLQQCQDPLNNNQHQLQQSSEPLNQPLLEQMIMCQSNPDNIVNQNIKVKVEDENILDAFKNEFENRFMKTNEDVLPPQSAKAKRKRKKRSTGNNNGMQKKVKITTNTYRRDKLQAYSFLSTKKQFWQKYSKKDFEENV